jgi:serine protease Do
MFDSNSQDSLVVYGLYFQDTFSRGEQDICNNGFGCDGQLVQPSAAEPRDGTPPGDKVAGLACAGKVNGHLSLVGRGIHPWRVQRITTALDVPRIDSVANYALLAAIGGYGTLKSRSTAISAALAFVLGTILLAGCSEREPGLQADNTAKAPPQASILADEPVARVASKVGPSVVQVNVRAVRQTPLGTQRGEGLGSGVIYRRDGYIVTNNHVIEGATGVNVAFADGTIEDASIVGTDPNTEIAVIKVDRNDLPAATFDDVRTPVVGQLAVAIGSPSGFESTVTSGVVSGVGREFPPELTSGGTPERSALTDLIQTDAAISPGNSGGALADRDGEIIGINVAYLPPAETGAVNLGFAVPSDTAVSVADQLIEKGEVTTPYLGVLTTDLSPEDAARFDLPVDSGALVEQVVPGSAAREAGVRKGDIITALGDARIAGYGDLLGALRDHKPGERVALTIFRNTEEKKLEVTLGEMSQ